MELLINPSSANDRLFRWQKADFVFVIKIMSFSILTYYYYKNLYIIVFDTTIIFIG